MVCDMYTRILISCILYGHTVRLRSSGTSNDRAGDVGRLRDIEQFYHIQIEEMPMNIADLI